MELRSEFGYDTKKASDDASTVIEGESLTQQNQKEEADINTIVKRFGLSGELPQGVRMPQYGDFTGIRDYQSALNAVREANDAFMQLPPFVRERFQNDPEQFVNFCLDPKNEAEAIKLGLVEKKATEPAPPAVQGGTDAGAQPPSGGAK